MDEQQVVNVLESLSDAFFSIDQNWRMTYVNAEHVKLTHLSREAQLGHDVRELFFSDPEVRHSSCFLQHCEKVMNTREAYRFEDFYSPLNLWLAVRACPQPDGGLAIFFKDVTEEKKAKESLVKAIEARDTFLSIASHELRTPITGMKLQTQMMKRAFAKNPGVVFSPEKIFKLVNQMDEGLTRMNRLVEDMLDISRIQGGKLSLQMENSEFNSFVRTVVERFREDLLNVGIFVTFRPAPEELRVSIDRFRMEQVLTNLITNAIRYASQAPVFIDLIRQSEVVVLSFQDGGPGIAPENQERIFERFERLISANEISGMGLGLYIAKQIVQAHGGTIRVEPHPQPGARFIIQIPLIKENL